MMDILQNGEQAYGLGATLMILSNAWMWIALLSYINRRRVRFALECMLTIAFYLPALACLLAGMMVKPAGSILKILFHTILIVIPVIIIIHKHSDSENNCKIDLIGDESLENFSDDNEPT